MVPLNPHGKYLPLSSLHPPLNFSPAAQGTPETVPSMMCNDSLHVSSPLRCELLGLRLGLCALLDPQCPAQCLAQGETPSALVEGPTKLRLFSGYRCALSTWPSFSRCRFPFVL